MPDKHLAYKHGQGYNAAYFLEEAALVGSNTTSAVQSLLNRTKHVEQSYKSCNVLEKNLDQVDGEETVSNVPQNDYVRGAEAFVNI